MKNNEKKIYLSSFEPKVAEGPVKFLVLDAKYDEIPTKYGKKEIVKLKLELKELNNPDSEKEVKSINLFVDYHPGGLFHKFVNDVITATSATAFQPSMLINLKGEAILSHYTPKGKDYAYAQINNWIFYKSNEEVSNALERYQEDDDIDIDFEEDGGEIV